MPDNRFKNTIRKDIFEQRKQLAPEEINERSNSIAYHLFELPTYKNAHTIAYYLAVNGEANPKILYKNKHPQQAFYLPVINANNALDFILAAENTRYTNNQFKIPEPVPENKNDIQSVMELDIIIMPLVAIDRNGNRLGMGGGYYDRTLAFRHETNQRPLLIGFAYDFQLVNTLKPESWDIPVDIIVTESEIIVVNKSKAFN